MYSDAISKSEKVTLVLIRNYLRNHSRNLDEIAIEQDIEEFQGIENREADLERQALVDHSGEFEIYVEKKITVKIEKECEKKKASCCPIF